jgi:hypothetical protein
LAVGGVEPPDHPHAGVFTKEIVMLRRVLPLVLAALAVTVFAAVPALADKGGEKAEKADKNSHEGTVVSVEEGKLTMTDKSGKNEHQHQLAEDVKITIDGKERTVADLKKGMKIKVTTKAGDKKTVVRVDARRASDKDRSDK